MPHVITSACVDVKHQGCARVCPVGAIGHDGSADRILYVDPRACIDCRGCVAECPGGAIREDVALSPAERGWIEVNALWFEDKEAARRRVDELGA